MARTIVASLLALICISTICHCYPITSNQRTVYKCHNLLNQHEHNHRQNTGFDDLLFYKKFLCLISLRMEVGRDVAAYKWHNHIAILDPEREKQVLNEMVHQSKLHGLDTKWSTQFFNDQIIASRTVQENKFTQWKKNNTAPDSQIDLNHDIRPKIDKINNQLILLAKSTNNFRSTPWCSAITEYEIGNLDLEFKFDDTESDVLELYALRNVCQ